MGQDQTDRARQEAAMTKRQAKTRQTGQDRRLR